MAHGNKRQRSNGGRSGGSSNGGFSNGGNSGNQFAKQIQLMQPPQRNQGGSGWNRKPNGNGNGNGGNGNSRNNGQNQGGPGRFSNQQKIMQNPRGNGVQRSNWNRPDNKPVPIPKRQGFQIAQWQDGHVCQPANNGDSSGPKLQMGEQDPTKQLFDMYVHQFKFAPLAAWRRAFEATANRFQEGEWELLHNTPVVVERDGDVKMVDV